MLSSGQTKYLYFETKARETPRASHIQWTLFSPGPVSLLFSFSMLGILYVQAASPSTTFVNIQTSFRFFSSINRLKG